MSIDVRKLAWKYLGCSLYDLQDLIKEVYEQGRNDLLEEQSNKLAKSKEELLKWCNTSNLAGDFIHPEDIYDYLNGKFDREIE